MKKKPKDITIYYSNVNGFKLKQESIRKIVDNLQPKIIVLCETKLASGKQIKKVLPEYGISTRETKAGQGGIAIAVKLQTFNDVLDVTNTDHKNILTTRIKMAATSIRVIAGYAPQETEVGEQREHFFNELEVEITKCRMDGELPIIIGDLNSKIESRNGQVAAKSANGTLLCNILNNYNLDVLNYNVNCEGKWTHVIRTSGASSVLDYCIVDKEITRSVIEILIDEDCVYCPFWIVKKRGREEPKFSDHNAMIIKLSMEHIAKKNLKSKLDGK
jgi:hypothetical protein